MGHLVFDSVHGVHLHDTGRRVQLLLYALGNYAVALSGIEGHLIWVFGQRDYVQSEALTSLKTEG